MIQYTHSCEKLAIEIVGGTMKVRTPFWSSGFAASFKDLGGSLNRRTGNFEIWASQETEVRELLLYFFGRDGIQQAELVNLGVMFVKKLVLDRGAFPFAGRNVIEVDQKCGKIKFGYGVRMDCEDDKISTRRRGLHWEIKFHQAFSFVLRDVSAEFASHLVASQINASVLLVSIK